MGLALTIGLLAGACAPSGPSRPTPPAAGTVPPLPTAAGTTSPADIEATLTRITQYDQQLKQLAADNPSPDDLVSTMQEILTLMDYVTLDYPQMSTQQRTRALNGMTGILGDEISVVNTQSRLFQATATAFATAHPSPTTPPGTPSPVAPSPQPTPAPTVQPPTATIVGAGTPTGATIAQQISGDLAAIRNQATSLASDQPTDQDIVGLLGRMQADLNRLSQQFTGMSDSDVVSVLRDTAQTLAFLLPVAQTYVGQETSSIATPTPPPTPTPPTTSTPATTPTPGS
jgi:hypothetical protein